MRANHSILTKMVVGLAMGLTVVTCTYKTTQAILHEESGAEKEARQKAEARRRLEKADRDYAKLSKKLTWSEWSARQGLEIRLGMPKTVRIGEVFEVWVEVRGLPGTLDPEQSLLRIGPWEPGFDLIVTQREQTVTCSPWSWARDPRSHSVPFSDGYDLNLLDPAQPVQRVPAQYLIPRDAHAIKPGPANFAVQLVRDTSWIAKRAGIQQSTHASLWLGSVRSRDVPITLGPAETITHALQVPKRMRIEEQPQFATADMPASTRMVTMLYRREDSEEIKVDLPTGALVVTAFSWLDSSTERTFPLGESTFDLRPFEEHEGQSAYAVSGPVSGTVRLTMSYCLPDDASRTFVQAWTRDLPVSYTPKPN